jgi:hypothetical protein
MELDDKDFEVSELEATKLVLSVYEDMYKDVAALKNVQPRYHSKKLKELFEKYDM